MDSLLSSVASTLPEDRRTSHRRPLMPSRTLSIECVPISSVRLNPQNPRLHSRKQLRQLANSIRSFGFNVPVLVDAQSRVIAGHGRMLAARLLGMTEVPAIRVEHRTDLQARA